MHNYHDVYGHFRTRRPSSGSTEKRPRSCTWNCFPFWKRQACLREYRMNEPWDGPDRSKKILDKMPASLRSPFRRSEIHEERLLRLYWSGDPVKRTKGNPRSAGHQRRHHQYVVKLWKQKKRNGTCLGRNPKTFPSIRRIPLRDVRGFVEGQFFAALADGSRHMFENDKVKDQTYVADPPGTTVTRFTGIRSRRSLRQNDVTCRRWASQSSGARQEQPENARAGNAQLPRRQSPFSRGRRDWARWQDAAQFAHRNSSLLDPRALSRRYRMNEPWSSPANKQLYGTHTRRSPQSLQQWGIDERRDYFFAGPDTAAESAEFATSPTSTSNTILIVEAKRGCSFRRRPQTYRSIPTNRPNSRRLCAGSQRGRDVRRIIPDATERITSRRIISRVADYPERWQSHPGRQLAGGVDRSMFPPGTVGEL